MMVDKGGEAGTALDPAVVLPDWSSEEHKTSNGGFLNI
jgi:hypothetical protein